MAKHRKRWIGAYIYRTLNRPLGYTRKRLAANDALLIISILGVLAGALAAGFILLFRWTIDAPMNNWLPGDFEALPALWRFALPTAGGLLLGLALLAVKSSSRSVGLSHVIHVTNNLHGELPARNAIVQFVAGSIAILSGQAGGREGPAVHLGAAITSWASRTLHLPRNSSRILISCGTAAAIAASFNTPIAGVIFAMEVVMLEFTIAGFTPVILAAITATLMTRASFGAEPMFAVEVLQMTSFYEVFFIAMLGLCCGLVSAAFLSVQRLCLRLSHINIALRLTLAGLVTGAVGYYLPEVLGLGYDTLAEILRNNIAFSALAVIVAGKLAVTAISCGLGMPLGFIGPALIIGAGMGGLLGLLGNQWQPELASETGFYVLLGMGALVGAVLNAPLTALLTIVELTNSAHIMLPGMLAIITATLTSNGVFKQNAAQHAILLSQGFRVQSDPLSLALQRASVANLMERSFRRVALSMTFQQIQRLLENRPRWLLVAPPEKTKRLIDSTDLILHIEELSADQDPEDLQNLEINLLEIPGKKRRLAEIQPQATLREAWELMNNEDAEALYVSGPALALYLPPSGIITREDIENYYRNPLRRRKS